VPAWIGVSGGTEKFLPRSAVPANQVVSLDAAKNEFEPFQVVINGGANGVTVQSAVLSDLSDSGKTHTVSSSKSYIYVERYYDVSRVSSSEGSVGRWPDPMIPDVDPFYREKRNAFPLSVPANETRVIWVDLYVPQDSVAGQYQGNLTLTFGGNSTVALPVALRVRNFALPSTASLPTFYGLQWDACVAHLGSYATCGDNGIEQYLYMYGIAGLDHRLTFSSIYTFPNNNDWTHFDSFYGPLLDGTAATILPGAQWRSVGWHDSNFSQQYMTQWKQHAVAKGWADNKKLFFYTVDEPADAAAWQRISTYGPTVQAAGLSSLVTVDYNLAVAHNVLDDIDLLVPLMNHTSDTEGTPRSAYDTWLQNPAKDLWWYVSCISHGCSEATTAWETNWPSYVIDSPAMEQRALEWYTFANDVHGELYFEISYKLATAWEDQWAFGGNGDGTLLYPGIPDASAAHSIGGTHNIPILSMRLKLIREGLEDYEYLHILEQRSPADRDWARAKARALFAWHAVNSTTYAQLLQTRKELADRIEQAAP
jgi:hypothetical protein